MESLKKLPELLQQHYEKVLLGIALAALVLSGILLAQERQSQETALQEYLVTARGMKPFPYTNITWSLYYDALRQATNVLALNFTKPRLHNLFGPVKWQRRPDGSFLKIELGNEVGAEALKITKITPLYLIISLINVSGTTGYNMGVIHEASTNLALRRIQKPYVSLAPPGNKDRYNTFTLKEVKGTPEEPELVLELTDTGDKASVFKDKPFRRVDGYKADLTYPPENKPFSEKRVNDTVSLAGEDYIIIAISQNEVVLSARSNNKRTTLRYNAAP